MMGVLTEQAAEFAEERQADIVALNCGTGMDMVAAARVARVYRAHCKLPVMVQPNAGQPVMEGLKAVYKQRPEDMARAVLRRSRPALPSSDPVAGSAPEHTRAIRRERRRICPGRAGP